MVILFSQTLFALEKTQVFVDKGACPFECCTYREWTVIKNTVLFDAINGKNKVGTAKKVQKRMVLPEKFIRFPWKWTKQGKEIYLLTYQGECFWKIWVDGNIKSDVEQDWDDKRPKSTWWVQIKLSDGTAGWTKAVENFGEIDVCGKIIKDWSEWT